MTFGYVNSLIREFDGGGFSIKIFHVNITFEFVGEISDFLLKRAQGYARFPADSIRLFVFLNEKKELFVRGVALLFFGKFTDLSFLGSSLGSGFHRLYGLNRTGCRFRTLYRGRFNCFGAGRFIGPFFVGKKLFKVVIPSIPIGKRFIQVLIPVVPVFPVSLRCGI
jgi:hypothetical protein